MAGAGRENGDVAGHDLDCLAVIAAKADARAAAGNAERLVHGRMVVQIIEDAVAPHITPAVGAEQTFDGLFGMVVGDVERQLVDHEGHRVVRDQSIVLEHARDRLDIRADN